MHNAAETLHNIFLVPMYPIYIKEGQNNMEKKLQIRARKYKRLSLKISLQKDGIELLEKIQNKKEILSKVEYTSLLAVLVGFYSQELDDALNDK